MTFRKRIGMNGKSAVLLHDVPEDIYHGDPCWQPSLSASIARPLLDRSPKHAWHEHPRLNPNRKRDARERVRDVGSAVHAAALENDPDKIAYVDADSWRTNAAKQEYQELEAAGLIPLLAHQEDQVQEMWSELEPFLPKKFDAEVTLMWRDKGGIYCRCRLDMLVTNTDADHVGDHIHDLKTTKVPVTPRGWGRRVIWDHAVQCGLYRRGYHCLTGWWPTFRFTVQEQDPPYGVASFAFDSEALAYCDGLAERAVDLWGKCMDADRWPSYPEGVHVAELPAYLKTKAVLYEGYGVDE